MVDDAQATSAINRFKTNITSLGTPTTNLSKNMGILNNNFKNVSGGLTSTNTLFGQTATQATSLGTKIKATTSQFAGFATGLAVTASGALQLAAGFRDYNDAQIAVERVTRKNSLAHEALSKAQDKLKALTDKGIKSGKEYAQAQLDVSQAQSQVSIQTQLLGEAQERMFDSQTQFVASVIPTTLGAIGTLGMAFRELGGGKGIGGLVEKFKGLGSGITSGFIPALTGIGSKSGDAIKGIAGIGAASTTASVGVGGLKAALSGMALSLGALIGIPLTGIFAANALGNTFHEFHDAGDQIRKGQLEMAKSLGLTDTQVKQLNDSMNAINRIFGIYEPNVKNATTATNNLVKPSQQLQAAQDKLNIALKDPALKSHQTETAKAAKATLAHAQAEVDRLKAIENVTPAISVLGTGIKIYADNTKKATISTGELWKTWEVGGGKMASIIAGFGAPIDSLKKKFLELHNAMKPGTFTQGLLNYRQAFMDSFVNNPNAITKTVKDYKDLKTITDQTNAGAKALNQTWEVDAGAIAAKNTAKELEEARKKLEAFNKKIAEGVQAVGVTFKVKDNVEKFMKEIKKNLPNKIEKKIDMKLDFRGNVKDATTAFNSYLETATTMDEKTADGIVKGIIKTIDEKFKGKKGAFAGLRAQLEAEMKNPNTVQILKNNIANGDYTAAGKGIFSSVSAGITAAANAGGGLASLWENSTGKGIAIPAPVTTAFDTGIKTVQTTASTAVTNITTSLAKVSSVNIPTPNESIYQKGLQLAINNAGQTVKIIKSTLDKISGIKVPPPNEKNYQKGLQLAINNAAQTVKLIKKELDKVGGIKVPAPKFNDFNSALAQAVSDAKRAVRDINNALSNVKKKPSGNGSGPGATTGPFNTDTSNFSKSNSSSGGGDTIVYVNVLDETIMQKITRRSGRNRFTMGV